MRLSRAAFAFALAFVASSFVAPTSLAQSPATAESGRAAVVVVGDPAEATVDAARRLDEAVRAAGEVTLPADAAMVAALRGEAAPEVDDGLAPVRALRRQLGWSDEADAESLATLATRLELVAVVLVRGGDVPTARVYDVRAARRFNGETALDAASMEGAVRFVGARVRAAAQRTVPTPAEVAQASATENAPATPATDGATPGRPARRWFRRNWPYVLAGALVVGATVFFVSQRETSSSPPVIHIRPGGST